MLSAGSRMLTDIGQHIRHAHEVVVVVARAPQRLDRHQAKQVLEAQGDAHEGMILHLLHRDDAHRRL